ncbi:helix-turn-helix domain-containing protein [Roseibium sp. RKSG952]|uniref:helix-turn-helix domain-containing protein n=1 Tax=Roseibium sp. RKSG952 TaxID=2529384 RepID=UPI001FCB4C1D|nr:helix-turn-helix domain-containing protein [Roseibium sp. RKSG952]
MRIWSSVFIKDRQKAGIENAKAAGVYKGRKKHVDDSEIQRRIESGASKSAVARDMKISRMTVYRALANKKPQRNAR